MFQRITWRDYVVVWTFYAAMRFLSSPAAALKIFFIAFVCGGKPVYRKHPLNTMWGARYLDRFDSECWSLR